VNTLGSNFANPSKGLVSWCSSHEKDEAGKTITAIYVAELSLKE